LFGEKTDPARPGFFIRAAVAHGGKDQGLIRYSTLLMLRHNTATAIYENQFQSLFPLTVLLSVLSELIHLSLSTKSISYSTVFFTIN
jgi:hypothetical protein